MITKQTVIYARVPTSMYDKFKAFLDQENEVTGDKMTITKKVRALIAEYIKAQGGQDGQGENGGREGKK